MYKKLIWLNLFLKKISVLYIIVIILLLIKMIHIDLVMNHKKMIFLEIHWLLNKDKWIMLIIKP